MLRQNNIQVVLALMLAQTSTLWARRFFFALTTQEPPSVSKRNELLQQDNQHCNLCKNSCRTIHLRKVPRRLRLDNNSDSVCRHRQSLLHAIHVILPNLVQYHRSCFHN